MLRTITLSLLILVSVVVMLPFASSTAHGLRQASGSQQQRRYRRHSRAWWRRHRARLRLRRAAAMAHRNAPLGAVFTTPTTPGAPAVVLPQLPAGWNNAALANGGELRFRTENTLEYAGPGQPCSRRAQSSESCLPYAKRAAHDALRRFVF